MAEHEGWYVQAKVDISGLLQANKATTALVANLKKVDSGLSGIKPNESLAKSVKAADIATASYIERLKSAGKNYDADLHAKLMGLFHAAANSVHGGLVKAHALFAAQRLAADLQKDTLIFQCHNPNTTCFIFRRTDPAFLLYSILQ